MTTPRTTLLRAFAAAALLATVPLAASVGPDDEGQGTAQPNSRTDQLNAGQHLSGPTFSAEAALGKVVMVEIGGS